MVVGELQEWRGVRARGRHAGRRYAGVRCGSDQQRPRWQARREWVWQRHGSSVGVAVLCSGVAAAACTLGAPRRRAAGIRRHCRRAGAAGAAATSPQAVCAHAGSCAVSRRRPLRPRAAGRSPSNTGARRVTRLRVPPRPVGRRASLRCRFYIDCRLKVASSASPRPPSESGGSNSAGPATWRTQRPGGRGAGRAGSSGCRGQSARQPGSQSVSPSVSHRLALQIPQAPGGGEVRSGGPRCARRRPSTAERRANTRRCWHVPPASAQPALCSPPAVCQSNAARVCERHCSRAHPPTGQPVAASREQLPALRITSSAGGSRDGHDEAGGSIATSPQ